MKPPARKRGRRRLRALVSVAVLTAAVALLIRAIGLAGLRELGLRLVQADPLLLALAAAANLARYGLWALRWQWMVQKVVSLRWTIAFRSLMVSVFLNTVVPAARPLGGIIRARLAARHAQSTAGPYYGGTLVDQFGYSVVSGVVGAACLPWAMVGSGMEQGRGFMPWLLGGLLVLLGGALIHPGLRARMGAFMERRLPSARSTMAGAARASRQVLRRPLSYLLMIVGGTVVWMLNVVVLWIAGRAVGVPFSFEAAAAAWALGSLAGSLSGTPGGAGTTEGAAIIPLVREGAAAPEALAAVFLARGLHYLSALVIGGACFLARPAGSGPLTEAITEEES